MEVLCQSHNFLEWDHSRGVEEDGEVLYATDLHKLSLRANQIRGKEVQKKLRLSATKKEVVYQPEPIFLP